MNYLTQDVLWYEDLENIYLTPDIQLTYSDDIKVNYENNDHSKIVIECLDKYRLSLNLKYPIKRIKNIVGKQIVLEKEVKGYWKLLTIDKNNKVKTDWKNLNIESCYEVEELKIEDLDLSDNIENLNCT
jgi:hypothetical protein